jgi:hypothetical protein
MISTIVRTSCFRELRSARLEVVNASSIQAMSKVLNELLASCTWLALRS